MANELEAASKARDASVLEGHANNLASVIHEFETGQGGDHSVDKIRDTMQALRFWAARLKAQGEA